MSEVALWRSVIANAIAEARGQIISGDTKKRRPAIIANARDWIERAGEDFRFVCFMADLDPADVQRAALRQIEHGRPKINMSVKERHREAVRRAYWRSKGMEAPPKGERWGGRRSRTCVAGATAATALLPHPNDSGSQGSR